MGCRSSDAGAGVGPRSFLIRVVLMSCLQQDPRPGISNACSLDLDFEAPLALAVCWRLTELLALLCLRRPAARQQSLSVSVALDNRRRSEVGAPRRPNPHDQHPTMFEA